MLSSPSLVHISLINSITNTCVSCLCTLSIALAGQENHQSGWPTLSFAMGTAKILLCLFVGHFIPVHSLIQQDAAFPPAFPGFFGNVVRLPFKRNFDFPLSDNMFSPWPTWFPDFHMLAPPMISVPTVQISCDGSQLTLLVDKRFNDVILNEEDIHLGDGCNSNQELPNQFVFTYNFDQCGTTHLVS